MNEIIRKYANNKGLYIIIIIGIVFMLLPTGVKKNEGNIETQMYNDYSEEERLQEILSKIDGVGEVSVMITYYGTTVCDIAFEKKENSSERNDESARSEESSVITSDGEPLIKGVVYPKAKGVVIIAEGAENPAVKKSITDATVAALEVAQYRVCVLEGKERD